MGTTVLAAVFVLGEAAGRGPSIFIFSQKMIEATAHTELAFGMANKDPLPATPMAPLMAQLFYRFKPAIDSRKLKDAVIRYCGDVDPASTCGDGDNHAHFFMNEGLVEFKEGKAKSQLCLLDASSTPDDSKLDFALGQTWNWPEAKTIVKQCQHGLVAIDLMAAPLDAQKRSRLFRGFVRAILETVPANAIHFMNSQVVADPSNFLREQSGSLGDQLQSAINVRLFRIEEREREYLMDTMGLGVLGLPDIQCHFRDLECTSVANKLYGVALYLFEKGDVIEDSETIPGLREEKWRCQHEMALAGPERVVLDLNPGPLYAAGGRQ